MDFSCHHCRHLRGDQWLFSWKIPIPTLKMQVGRCQTCTLIFNAISAVLGPGFVAVYTYVLFPEREPSDFGSLRIDLQCPPYNPISENIQTCRVRIYTTPG
jgi:hypothetical protein